MSMNAVYFYRSSQVTLELRASFPSGGPSERPSLKVSFIFHSPACSGGSGLGSTEDLRASTLLAAPRCARLPRRRHSADCSKRNFVRAKLAPRPISVCFTPPPLPFPKPLGSENGRTGIVKTGAKMYSL